MGERHILIHSSQWKWVSAGATYSVHFQLGRPYTTTTKEVSTPMQTILHRIRALGALAVTYPRALQVPLLGRNDLHSLPRALMNLALTATARALLVIHQHIVLVVSSPYCLATDRPLSRLRTPPPPHHHETHKDSSTRLTHVIRDLASLTMILRMEAWTTGLIRKYAGGQDRIVLGLLTSGMTKTTVVRF